MDQAATGFVMVDPADPRRTVWVREQDRADFERRGYVAVPSESERSAGKASRPAAATTDAQPAQEPAEPAPAEEPASEATDEESEAATESVEPPATTDDQPATGVRFPRKRGRGTPGN
ncbi:MAG: hypothetical protein CVU47_06370 [Chloroflexi bacterium HGW-Chloroflexi-9]|nr:MAG: hypothetical protein CVU47_06370 [Chloroflexi bacterium HGW-Chloroflexi-9]